MKNMMQYQDYLGSIHYSGEDLIFYGNFECVWSLISFEREDVSGPRANFEMAINDDQTFCMPKGVLPEKPFNVWTGKILPLNIKYQYRK